MKFNLDLPNVSSCSATRCVYNANNTCQARAITVGNHGHAACDTFLSARTHVQSRVQSAGVGACKAIACAHNVDYECEAGAIRVGVHADHADCLTFDRR